jgi:hypothetical protein
MIDELFRVDCGEGKYTLIRHADGNLLVFRHGEPWHEFVAEEIILSLGYELRDARATMLDAHSLVEAQAEEIKRLRKIVEKLPKTADGVPVVHGADFVWQYHDTQKAIVRWSVEVDTALASRGRCYPVTTNEGETSDCQYITEKGGGCLSKQVSMCYSTREAAEAANAKA